MLSGLLGEGLGVGTPVDSMVRVMDERDNPRRACARVTVVNPRRACARVTVVAVCVYPSVTALAASASV